MPDVFLIQASGNATDEKSPANTYAEEPIEHGFYEHSNWHNQKKDEDFGKVSEGDIVLLYCTANVDESPKQIKYVFRVKDKIEDRWGGGEEGVPNKITLEQERELSPGFPLENIRQWVDEGKLSESMNRAGTQGFNIAEVKESDYETIADWSTSQEPEPAIEHYEEELRTFLVDKGLSGISEEYANYALYQDKDGNTGELYNTPIGEIDLLYEEPESGDLLVIELKRTKDTSDKVVGQIARYIGWVESEIADGSSVHGLIVAQTVSQRLRFAVRALSDCNLSTYRLQFSFSNVR